MNHVKVTTLGILFFNSVTYEYITGQKVTIRFVFVQQYIFFGGYILEVRSLLWCRDCSRKGRGKRETGEDSASKVLMQWIEKNSEGDNRK